MTQFRSIDRDLEIQAWQIDQIRKGIEAADQGELVPHEQVMDEIAAIFQAARRWPEEL